MKFARPLGPRHANQFLCAPRHISNTLRSPNKSKCRKVRDLAAFGAILSARSVGGSLFVMYDTVKSVRHGNEWVFNAGAARRYLQQKRITPDGARTIAQWLQDGDVDALSIAAMNGRGLNDQDFARWQEIIISATENGDPGIDDGPAFLQSIQGRAGGHKKRVMSPRLGAGLTITIPRPGGPARRPEREMVDF